MWFLDITGRSSKTLPFLQLCHCFNDPSSAGKKHCCLHRKKKNGNTQWKKHWGHSQYYRPPHYVPYVAVLPSLCSLLTKNTQWRHTQNERKQQQQDDGFVLNFYLLWRKPDWGHGRCPEASSLCWQCWLQGLPARAPTGLWMQQAHPHPSCFTCWVHWAGQEEALTCWNQCPYSA